MISASLRAQKLVSYVPARAQIETEGEDVTLVDQQESSGLTAPVPPAGRDALVDVEKRIVGRIASGRRPEAKRRPAWESVDTEP